jgi:hypothetical protein
VARWVHEIALRRNDAVYELVDIQDHQLPLLDEPMPPSSGHYSHAHTKAWAERIAEFDGYVFVTPEYNHGTTARSRTRSTTSTASGTTRRPGSSGMAARAALAGSAAAAHGRVQTNQGENPCQVKQSARSIPLPAAARRTRTGGRSS